MTDTSGPAFGHGAENGHCCGLTKRSWLAGMAMQGFLAAASDPNLEWEMQELTEKSYECATAMLRYEQEERGDTNE